VSSPPEIAVRVTLVKEGPADPGPAKQDALDKLAQLLAGGYAVLTAVLTVVGGLKGGLGRILLNHPWLTGLGILSLLAAIALALIAAHVVDSSDADKKTLRVTLVVISLVLFTVGIALFLFAEVFVTGDNQRPTITTKTSISAGASTLEGQVKAAGVKAKEWVYVSVNGFQEMPLATKRVRTTGHVGRPFKRSILYQTRAGPDLEGDVDVEFTIGFVPARFYAIRVGATLASSADDEQVDPCFTESDTETSGASQSPSTGAPVSRAEPAVDQSCATVYPPPGPRHPTLSASWEPSTGQNKLTVTVASSSVDPDGAVRLIVSAAPDGQVFYRSMFGPRGDGTVDAVATVSVPASVKRVCVVGSTTRAVKSTSHKKIQAVKSTRPCAVSKLDLNRSSFLITASPPK
jgi:hypothetical protein